MRSRHTIAVFLVLTSSAGLAACGGKSSVSPGERTDSTAAPSAPRDARLESVGYLGPAAAPEGAVGKAAAVQSQAAPSAIAAQAAARKLIRTGQVSLEVAAYATAAGEVARIAESRGGYVSSSQTTRAEANRQRGSVTVRVPAERFADTVDALKKLGKVVSESVATQDVTKAYADLETRLRVKRETEARLRDILRNRAAKLSDILEAERELARIIEEIEQAEGERRFYDQQVALSTLVVSLQEPEAVIRSSALEPLFEAFREALPLLAQSIAAIVYVVMAGLPWVVLLWALYLLVRRARRRARAKRAAVAASEQATR
jgi:hypothetical protein